MKLHPCIYISALFIVGISTANAQTTESDLNGWYASLYGTVSALPSSNLTETVQNASTLNGEAKFDTGKGFGGAVGKNFAKGRYALELAWDYQSAGLKSVGVTKVDGDYATNLFWVNGYRRFPNESRWTPYVGAGLGYVQEIDIDINRAGKESEYSRKGGLAAQAIIGVKRQVTTKWSIMADAKYMYIDKSPNRSSTIGNNLAKAPKYNPLSIHVGVVYDF